jgi:hypothetical protein
VLNPATYSVAGFPSEQPGAKAMVTPAATTHETRCESFIEEPTIL